MIDQLRESDADEPAHRRASRGNHGLFQLSALHQNPGGAADELRPAGHLKRIVKAHRFQCSQLIIHIVQIIKLAVQRWRRQRDTVFIIQYFIEGIALRIFRVVRADSDAFAAIDAALGNNVRLPITHTDCFRGAPLDAIGAALAFFLIQTHRMEKSLHLSSPLPRGAKPIGPFLTA